MSQKFNVFASDLEYVKLNGTTDFGNYIIKLNDGEFEITVR